MVGHFWSPGAYATTGEQQCDDSHWLFSCPNCAGVPNATWYVDGTIGEMGCESGCPTGEMIVSVEDSGYFAVGRVTRSAYQPAFDFSRIGRNWTMVPIPSPAILGSGTGDYAWVHIYLADPAPGFYGLSGMSAQSTITGFRLYGQYRDWAGRTVWIDAGRVPYRGGTTIGDVVVHCSPYGDTYLAAALEFDNGAVVTSKSAAVIVEDCDTAPRGAGAVPDGGPGSLLMGRAPNGNLTLEWGPSCTTTDHAYEIYEGTIGNWTSHAPRACNLQDLSSTLSVPPFNAYYLVAPVSNWGEGSYGSGVGGFERTYGASFCTYKSYSFCSP
jgi:hypothetical protein